MTRRYLEESVAGFLAAGAALGAGELIAGWVDAPSLVVAVANRVIALAPGFFLRFGIETLGSSDKPALLVSIVVIVLALGALLGPMTSRLPSSGVLVFAIFGGIGIFAETRSPLTSSGAAVLVAASAALAGYVTLRLLLKEAEAVPTLQMPGRAAGSRRRFLAFAATTAAGASVSAVIGRNIGPSVDVEAQRAGIVLPGGGPGPAAPPEALAIEGISPLVTPNEDFYRIDTAFVVPRVDSSTWRLSVKGMVDRPFELSFEELLALPSVEEPITLSCVSNEVGGDLAGNAVWRGVPLEDLLTRAGVQAGATQVVGRSVDDFTVGFPTEVALDGRASMVAYAMNGEPLPAVHGFPARLIVPGLYGYVSATKWLREIELTRLDAFDAYWISRGWAKEGPIKTQSRIDTPSSGRKVVAGRIPIAGVAWGGIRGISRVEVRITPVGSSSASWHQAKLGAALSTSSWRQWVVDDWEPAAGQYLLEVRATDGEGVKQTEKRHEPAPDGATGLHAVTVRVREA